MHDVIITGGKAVPAALFVVVTIAWEDRNGTVTPGETTAKIKTQMKVRGRTCQGKDQTHSSARQLVSEDLQEPRLERPKFSSHSDHTSIVNAEAAIKRNKIIGFSLELQCIRRSCDGLNFGIFPADTYTQQAVKHAVELHL